MAGAREQVEAVVERARDPRVVYLQAKRVGMPEQEPRPQACGGSNWWSGGVELLTISGLFHSWCE